MGYEFTMERTNGGTAVGESIERCNRDTARWLGPWTDLDRALLRVMRARMDPRFLERPILLPTSLSEPAGARVEIVRRLEQAERYVAYVARPGVYPPMREQAVAYAAAAFVSVLDLRDEALHARALAALRLAVGAWR